MITVNQVKKDDVLVQKKHVLDAKL